MPPAFGSTTWTPPSASGPASQPASMAPPILPQPIRSRGEAAIGSGLALDVEQRCGDRFLGRLAAPDDALEGREEPLGLAERRSEEHTSELQSQMRISYAVCCW